MKLKEFITDISVTSFLNDAGPRKRRSYSIRDNCGPAALDMLAWASNKGVELERKSGYFVADEIVYHPKDFTSEMRAEFQKTGLDFASGSDRKSFINQYYHDEWKKIPHYWLEDSSGKIYDPSGPGQFLKTGLAADLHDSRYITVN